MSCKIHDKAFKGHKMWELKKSYLGPSLSYSIENSGHGKQFCHRKSQKCKQMK